MSSESFTPSRDVFSSPYHPICQVVASRNPFKKLCCRKKSVGMLYIFIELLPRPFGANLYIIFIANILIVALILSISSAKNTKLQEYSLVVSGLAFLLESLLIACTFIAWIWEV